MTHGEDNGAVIRGIKGGLLTKCSGSMAGAVSLERASDCHNPNHSSVIPEFVIPAKAGIRLLSGSSNASPAPAFAGVTEK
jgi:hypothetical protein